MTPERLRAMAVAERIHEASRLLKFYLPKDIDLAFRLELVADRVAERAEDRAA